MNIICEKMLMNSLPLRFVLFFLLLPGAAFAGDPPGPIYTLAEAVSFAQLHNPAIKEAEAVIAGAEAEVSGAVADRRPKAATQYSYSRLAEQPYQRVGGYDRLASDENVHHWDVSLTQPLFSGFALTGKEKMARIGQDRAELERQRARIWIGQDVRVAWYECLLADRLARLAEENVTALASHQRQAEGFFREGLISRNDLLKAQTALAQAKQDREKSLAATTVSRARLAVLLGGELPRDRRLEDFPPLAPTEHVLADLLGEALAKNPVLGSYRLGLDQLDQSIRVAGSTAYPSLSLVGKYEQNGSQLGAIDNDYSNENNASIALAAKWEFFDWGKTDANIAKQQAEKARLAARITALEDQIRFEVQQAVLDCSVAGTNISTAEQGLGQARENWRITELQYQNQVATSTDVLDSRTLLSQAETNYFRALYGYRIAEAQLARSVGRD